MTLTFIRALRAARESGGETDILSLKYLSGNRLVELEAYKF
jgi:hypothetical protein